MEYVHNLVQKETPPDRAACCLMSAGLVRRGTGSGPDLIAFLGDHGGQRLAWLAGFDINPVLGPVDRDLGLRVQGPECLRDGLFAMAASHSGNGESLLHEEFL